MYENKKATPLTPGQFRVRVLRNSGLVLGMILSALAVGVLGYHFLGELGWVDSILNASMILGGMGPVDSLKSDPAKLFASVYALFSGVFFISISGLFLAPFAHRMLHKLHAVDEDDEEEESRSEDGSGEQKT